MRRDPVRGGRILAILLALAACGGAREAPEAPEDALGVLGPVRLGMAEPELRESLRSAGIEVRCTGSDGTLRCGWMQPDSTLSLRYFAHEGRVFEAVRQFYLPSRFASVGEFYDWERKRLPGASTEGSADEGSPPALVWGFGTHLERLLVCTSDEAGRPWCYQAIGTAVAGDEQAERLPDPLADSIPTPTCEGWTRRLMGSC